MIWQFFEVTNKEQNWGKFAVGHWEDPEWRAPSEVAPATGLLHGRGWTWQHFLILDLETGEGAIFRHGGCAEADLEKHAIWVCPLFLPFLTWLYEQDVHALLAHELPTMVQLPDAPFAFAGQRWPGKGREASGERGEPIEGGTDAV